MAPPTPTPEAPHATLSSDRPHRPALPGLILVPVRPRGRTAYLMPLRPQLVAVRLRQAMAPVVPKLAWVMQTRPLTAWLW